MSDKEPGPDYKEPKAIFQVLPGEEEIFTFDLPEGGTMSLPVGTMGIYVEFEDGPRQHVYGTWNFFKQNGNCFFQLNIASGEWVEIKREDIPNKLMDEFIEP